MNQLQDLLVGDKSFKVCEKLGFVAIILYALFIIKSITFIKTQVPLASQKICSFTFPKITKKYLPL